MSATASPALPVEVLRRVVSVADPPTSATLALTSKTFRIVAEERLYEHCDLTGRIQDHNDLIHTTTDSKSFVAATEAANRRLYRFETALEARPERRENIRDLRVQPNEWEEDALIDLLCSLDNSRLRSLAIVPIVFERGGIHPGIGAVGMEQRTGSKDFFRQLSAMKISFPKLEILQYALSAEATSRDLSWIGRLQSLREIHISTCSPMGYGPLPDFSPLPRLPNLRSLTFTGLSIRGFGRAFALLNNLLTASPNLITLRLLGIWQAKPRDTTTRLICGAKHLSTLIAIPPPEYTDETADRACEVKYLGSGRRKLRIERAVLNGSGGAEECETVLEDIRLPKAHRLRHLTLLTNPRPPSSAYAGVGIDPPHPYVLPLPPIFIRQLERCPVLTSIRLAYIPLPIPSAYDADYVDPVYFVPESEWVTSGDRGLIIRQYVRSQSDRPHFWHVRLLSRAVMVPGTDDAYLGIKRAWTDMASFAGQQVPTELLRKVYGAAGLTGEFETGARGIQMPDKGWRVLEDWFSEHGYEPKVEEVADNSDDEVGGGESDDGSDGAESSSDDED